MGLVLGAGGSVGHGFHVGTLAALAEAVGWDPRSADVVVGTSAGAVVGAMLRAGASPADLYRRAVDEPMSSAGRALFEGISWPTVRPAAVGPRRLLPAGRPGRVLLRWLTRPGRVSPTALAASALPPGRIPSDQLRDAVRHLYRARDGSGPDRCWPDRALWITAVRVGDGARVVFGRSGSGAAVDVGTAVTASCAIPGLDRPVRIEGDDHVDGGWHSALNADLLADQPLDLVVVCSPMTSAGRRPSRRADLPLRLLLGAQLEREVGRLRRRAIPVVVFEPDPAELAVMGGNPLDTRRREPVARQALASTRRMLGEAGLVDALAPLRHGSG